jgi:hypothetical protein
LFIQKGWTCEHPDSHWYSVYSDSGEWRCSNCSKSNGNTVT